MSNNKLPPHLQELLNSRTPEQIKAFEDAINKKIPKHEVIEIDCDGIL